MCAGCWPLIFVRCLLLAEGWSSLFVVRCSPCVVDCVLRAACCLLTIGCDVVFVV